MQLGKLMANERELILRSLAFCGIRVIVPISNGQGRFQLSEVDLQEQEIKEIHLVNTEFPGIIEALEHIGFVKKHQDSGWTIFVPKETMLHDKSFDGVFKVGHLVILNTGLYNEPSGTMAVIVEIDEKWCSIITENGIIISSFGIKERNEMIIFIKDTGLKYEFKDSIQLNIDWMNGLFKEVFK